MFADALPRLVIINPWDKRIGPNRYLVELLRQLPALAQNSIVILPAEGEAADEYRSIGCRVEVWQAARLVHVGLSAKKVWRMFYTHTIGVLKVWRRLYALRAQIVLTNSENVWVGGIAARLLGVPHLQVFHALTLEYNWSNRRWLAGCYLRFLSLWNTRFIAVSQAVAKMLMKSGISFGKVTIIPNGLDISGIEKESYEPLPKETSDLIKGRSPILVSVGRIAAMKGHDVIIEAMANVVEKYPLAFCLFAGERGSEEGIEDTKTFYVNLHRRIRQLNLENHIAFLGEITYVPSLLRWADIYVHASRTESFCRAIAEALICQKPVVATEVGGIPEVVGNQGAILVSMDDSTAFAKGIIEVMETPALAQRLVSAGRAHVFKHFNVHHVVPLLQHLICDEVRSGEDIGENNGTR